MIGPLRRLSAVPAVERRLFLEALVLLALARLAVASLPFPLLMRWFGLRRNPVGRGGCEGAAVRARQIGVAVRRAARYAPFAAVCLPRALAASVMLRRRRLPSELRFGAAREDERGLSAHAWCLSGGAPVIGTVAAAGFTEVIAYYA